MVFVFHGRDRAKCASVFDKLSRLRYQVFIKNRGWSLPSRAGCEVDEYDTDEAAYLVDFDDNGEVLAHVRMTPTMTSSLTADYFPHLVECGASIRDAKIFEGTRFMVLPTQRDKSRYREVKARFLAGATEWLMEQGATHFQTVIDAGTLASYVEVSPLVTPLGLAHPFGGGKGVPGGGECLVFRLPVGPALLGDIRSYGSLPPRADRAWAELPTILA